MFPPTFVSDPLLSIPSPPKWAYLAVFSLAALLSFASLLRVHRVTERDTRRGLAALLATSGLWAVAHVGFLATIDPTIAEAFYVVGLVVGLAAVGEWLYFVSAYTGRTYHRNTTVRRVALGVFLAIVAVKVTNPLHHLYVTSEVVTVPFEHVAITTQPFHWLVMGLSYSLAAVGYFMLFERLSQVSYDTKPLAALVAITGLPVILDVVGFASPILIDITYEPIGVAVFAVGVFFVFLDRFQSIRLAGEHDDPVLVLDDEGRLRDFNRAASTLFGERLGPRAVGEPVDSLLPELPDWRGEGEPVFEVSGDGTRYYHLSANPFGAATSAIGEILILSDVTNSERYRRELERQNERLERFASVVSHDLRNPLTVARGRLELALGRADSGSGDDTTDLETAHEAVERMDVMIEDLLALARRGQPIDDPEPVELADLARQSWSMVATDAATLAVDGDLAFEADPDRLKQLFENLFRNAVDHGGRDVSVRVGRLPDGGGFVVEDDGPGIPVDERDDVFEFGFSTGEHGSGFGLAIVAEIVDAHGWAIDVGESESGGARFEITGLQAA